MKPKGLMPNQKFIIFCKGSTDVKYVHIFHVNPWQTLRKGILEACTYSSKIEYLNPKGYIFDLCLQHSILFYCYWKLKLCHLFVFPIQV